MKIDDSPRRVWTGLTVPGKKMVRVMGASGMDAGRELNQLYSDPPYTVLLMVAHSLRRVPTHGALGPSLKDIGSSSTSPESMFYGAVLTDVRDFLKLRFRATGLVQALRADELTTGPFPSPANTAGVVNFVISALDSLSRTAKPEAEFYSAVKGLRDLLRAGAREADTRLGSPRAKFLEQMYDDPWD